MLGEREVLDLLMARGLLSPREVVDGGLAIRDVSRRNRNYRVTTPEGPSYLVKQGFGPEGRATVAHEAAAYAALADLDAPIDRYLPARHAWEPEHALLVLELLPRARSLADHQARGRFSGAVAAALGRALGTLHAATARPPAAGGDPPSAFWIHQPGVSWMRELSEANLALIRALQGAAGVVDMLDELRGDWRVDAVTHRDLKSDNCVVVRDAAGRGTGVRLVDWETAGPGDSAWDTGSVLGDYLASWLASIPITGEHPPERFAELARFPLARMRPALRRFWDGYVAAARLDDLAADRALIRAVRYSAARLVQTAFEQSQFSASLTGTTVCVVQVAVNVLRRPHEAAVRLLGIPLRAAAAA
jgi:Ser/Thr protein kinase RdoA (MazF antagonist)